MSKEFKEWRDKKVGEINYLGMDLAEMAWNHQQEKIDQLKALLTEAESIVICCASRKVSKEYFDLKKERL